MADLDHFKAINDTHGHPGGDQVLRHASKLLGSSVRATDMAARLGGEEFVVIAPNCDLQGALSTAERFRHRLASMPIMIAENEIRVTISIGVASWPEDPTDSASDLLAAADRRSTWPRRRGGTPFDTGHPTRTPENLALRCRTARGARRQSGPRNGRGRSTVRGGFPASTRTSPPAPSKRMAADNRPARVPCQDITAAGTR